MSITICRVGFCKACFDAKRPYRGAEFVVYGSFRKSYDTRKAMRPGTIGYTPHIFVKHDHSKGDICTISKVCCMCGCGCSYRLSADNKVMLLRPVVDKWEIIFMPMSDWNALVDLKRDRQYHL
jgi:hypothetical protein